MTLTTRLDKIAAALGRDDDFVAILIVFEDPIDGRWSTFAGEEIDPATVDPRTQLIIFRERPDGPQ